MSDLPTEESMFAQLAKTREAAWQIRFSKADIEDWLSNFQGEVHSTDYERQLALWLLLNFVYYNPDEVMHLCRVLFREFLHRHVDAVDPTSSARDPRTALMELLDHVLFYQLGRPGESGGFVLYHFRLANDLPLPSFVTSPDRIPSRVNKIIFVDDVCLSGTQAQKYLRDVTPEFNELKRIVLTLLATRDAQNLLAQDDTALVAAHWLDERSKCFSPKANMFAGYEPHRQPAEQLARHYGAKACAEKPLGYNEDGYAFGFYYNTPDNTLPIFWSERDSWKPIMKRYDKKYRKMGEYDFGVFI